MKYNPETHHRRSIRLQGYDYSKEGVYFVTICTQDRACILSEIVGADPVSARNAATLGTIIQSFKTRTTHLCAKGVHDGKYEPFNKRLWQRNYHERVIRNEKELFRIIQYIENNPANWQIDSEFVS